MNNPMSNILFLLLSLVSLLPASTSATCYWQNSTLAPNDQYSIATDDVACFPSQQNSPCCATGWSCLSDGVCYIKQSSNEFYYRGTCTDKMWNSQQCPGWCFAQNNSTSIPLTKCKKNTGEDWYCCPGDPDCDCGSGKYAIKLGASAPVTVTVIGSTSWPGYVKTSTPMTAGNIAQTTASANTMPAAASATESVPPASTSSPTSNGNTTALAVGLGAGAGIAVLILGIGAFWLFLRSRKRHVAGSTNGHFANHRTSPAALGVTPFNTTSHYIPVTPRPRPGEGYYATQVVNEKDGTQWVGTQEMPTYDINGQTHQDAYGYYSKDQTAEVEGSAHNAPRRVELA